MPPPPTSWTSTGTTRRGPPRPSRPPCWPSPPCLPGCSAWGHCSCSGGCCRPHRWPARAPVGSPAAAWSGLGVPLLVFVVLIDPFTDYLGSLAEGAHPRLWAYLVDQAGIRDTGPLWFVALLLLLSLAYAAVRRLHPVRVGGAVNVDPRCLVAVAAGIAVGS